MCKLRLYREVEALRWKHRVEFFDVPVCGRIAILTNQSSAVSLCTSQFKYPLRFKYLLKYSNVLRKLTVTLKR